MSVTIVPGDTIAVQSPYNRDFAYQARQCGGTWDRDSKVWRFTRNFPMATLQSMCQRYYGDAITVADALPVPEAVADAGHVGVVGQTIRVSLEITKVADFDGAYGATRLHVMRDSAGHVFTWYASTARYDVGSSVVLEGKIKKHDIYQGISQTVLTRCRKF